MSSDEDSSVVKIKPTSFNEIELQFNNKKKVYLKNTPEEANNIQNKEKLSKKVI